jgi:hypothetical protein
MATYTYTSSRYETSPNGILRLVPFQVTVPLSKMDTETDTTYFYRIHGTAVAWLTQVSHADIPADGPVAALWKARDDIQGMSDDELSDTLGNMNDDQDGVLGVIARTMIDLLELECDRREHHAEMIPHNE